MSKRTRVQPKFPPVHSMQLFSLCFFLLQALSVVKGMDFEPLNLKEAVLDLGLGADPKLRMQFMNKAFVQRDLESFWILSTGINKMDQHLEAFVRRLVDLEAFEYLNILASVDNEAVATAVSRLVPVPKPSVMAGVNIERLIDAYLQGNFDLFCRVTYEDPLMSVNIQTENLVNMLLEQGSLDYLEEIRYFADKTVKDMIDEKKARAQAVIAKAIPAVLKPVEPEVKVPAVPVPYKPVDVVDPNPEDCEVFETLSPGIKLWYSAQKDIPAKDNDGFIQPYQTGDPNIFRFFVHNESQALPKFLGDFDAWCVMLNATGFEGMAMEFDMISLKVKFGRLGKTPNSASFLVFRAREDDPDTVDPVSEMSQILAGTTDKVEVQLRKSDLIVMGQKELFNIPGSEPGLLAVQGFFGHGSFTTTPADRMTSFSEVRVATKVNRLFGIFIQ